MSEVPLYRMGSRDEGGASRPFWQRDEQIIFFNCLHVYQKSPDSGERQYK